MHPRIARIGTIFSFIMVMLGFSLQAPLASAQQKLYDSSVIESTPANPAPGQNVVIEIKNLSSDISHANISWYNGTKLLQKGSGLSQITVVAPTNGKSLVINAVVLTLDGKTSNLSTVVSAGEVNMTWEALTYIPPLYKGRSLYSTQSNIKIVALPNLRDKNGKLIDPSDLVYTWKKDATVLGSLSGYGKQSLIVFGQVVSRPFTITVDVASRDNTIKGQGYMDLDTIDPQTVAYQEDPLYGILYNRALPDHFTLANETKVVAEPYYFSVVAKNSPSLHYTWSINNLEQSDVTGPSLVLRSRGDIEGSSLVSVKVDNLVTILQSATADIQTYFNKAQQESLPTFQ